MIWHFDFIKNLNESVENPYETYMEKYLLTEYDKRINEYFISPAILGYYCINEDYHIIMTTEPVINVFRDLIVDYIYNNSNINLMMNELNNTSIGYSIISKAYHDKTKLGEKYTAFIPNKNNMFNGHPIILKTGRIPSVVKNGVEKYASTWIEERKNMNDPNEPVYLYINFYKYNTPRDIDLTQILSDIDHELRHGVDQFVVDDKNWLTTNTKNNIHLEDFEEFEDLISDENREFLKNLFYYISYSENRGHYQGIHRYAVQIINALRRDKRTLDAFIGLIKKLRRITKHEGPVLDYMDIIIGIMKFGKMEQISNHYNYWLYVNSIIRDYDNTEEIERTLICGYYLKKHKLMKYIDDESPVVHINDYLKYTDL